MSVVGNKNAEKWTEQTVLERIMQIESDAKEDSDKYTLSSLSKTAGVTVQWWSEMANKFIENKVVSEAMQRIEDLIENRIINDTMTGKARSSNFSIFLLKNKFGYKDKTEQDITTQGEKVTSSLVLPKGETMESLKQEIQDLLIVQS